MKNLKRIAATGLLIGLLAVPATTSAASPDVVGLGLTAPFAILAGATVTNTGPTVVTGDLGLHPGTDVTEFPPGILIGTEHVANQIALDAKNALITAYNDAASRAPDTATNYDTVGGRTLEPGVYNATSTMGLTGTLTLDALGDPDAVWIFQVGTALITAPDSSVSFVNGVGQPCNVFWQVGSDTTIGTNTTFVGNILGLNSIWVQTGASIAGRALAQVGEVTLDNNIITRADCALAPEPTPAPVVPTPAPASPSASPSASPTVAPSASPSASPTAAPSASPTATPTLAPSATPTLAPSAAPAIPSNPVASAPVIVAPVIVAPLVLAPTAPVAAPSNAAATAAVPVVNSPRENVPVPQPDFTMPPTDTEPLVPLTGSSSTFGGILVLLGSLMVLAAALIVRSQPARR